MIICNRPLSAVLAALAVAVVLVLMSELSGQPPESPAGTAETLASR